MIDKRREIYLNYVFEIEVTNYCNADCVFCANKVIRRQRGYLDVIQFTKFIKNVQSKLDLNIFHDLGLFNYPRITFCGLGDPLLHPNIVELVAIAHSAKLYTQIVTNGVLLNKEKLSALVDAGLDEIDISFHSINSSNYRAITGLNIESLKNALTDCKDILASNKLKVSFWRIKHLEEAFADSDQDQKSYEVFLHSIGLGNCEVLGPSDPWNRGGYISNSKCNPVKDSPFWCNKIIFTMNIDWQGNLLLCCNDYNCEQVVLGNIFDENFQYQDYINKKLKILGKEDLPSICRNCRRWSDNEIYTILKTNDIDSDLFLQKLQSTVAELKNGLLIESIR